jgi:hypothetical protein
VTSQPVDEDRAGHVPGGPSPRPASQTGPSRSPVRWRGASAAQTSLTAGGACRCSPMSPPGGPILGSAVSDNSVRTSQRAASGIAGYPQRPQLRSRCRYLRVATVAAPAFGVATMCAVSHVRPMPTDRRCGGAVGADLPIRYMGCESRPIDLIRLHNSSGEPMRPDCDLSTVAVAAVARQIAPRL